LEFRFSNKKLLAMYEKETGSQKLPRSVERAFFKVMAIVESMPDERELYHIKSLRYEKLKGERGKRGERSLRLTDQWRLIFTVEEDNSGKFLNFREIVDYH